MKISSFKVIGDSFTCGKDVACDIGAVVNPNQQEILSRLDALAAKLGVAGNHLWELSIRQQKIGGIEEIIFSGILIILAISFGFWAKREFPKANRRSEDPIGAVLLLFVSVGVFIIGAALLFGGINSLLNPEYFAFEHITKLLLGQN